jgi:hypothetical protein
VSFRFRKCPEPLYRIPHLCPPRARPVNGASRALRAAKPVPGYKFPSPARASQPRHETLHAFFRRRARGGNWYNATMARFLHRVRLENYKSIAHCDVELKDLTFLVGPNGAGKSNFISISTLFFISQELKNAHKNDLNDLWKFFKRRDSKTVKATFYGTFGEIQLNTSHIKPFKSRIKRGPPH